MLDTDRFTLTHKWDTKLYTATQSIENYVQILELCRSERTL